MGPETACGISAVVGKNAIGEWINKAHKKHWDFITEQTCKRLPSRIFCIKD
jgi:hypothetical protein